AVDGPVTRAQTDNGPALGNFIQRGEGIGDYGRIAIDHVGDGSAEANLFRVQRAQSHDLVRIDIVHMAVGEEDRLKTDGLGALGTINRFLNAARRAMKTKVYGHNRPPLLIMCRWQNPRLRFTS